MDKIKKEQLEFRYAKMPEISYYVLLIVNIVVVFLSTIGTFFVRKVTNNEIVLIPDNAYNFLISLAWIYVIPITVKILGKEVIQVFSLWQGKNLLQESKDEEKTYSQNVQNSYEEFIKK